MAAAEIRSLDLRAGDRLALARAVERGLSFAKVARLVRSTKLTEKRVAAVAQIKPRTWERRKEQGRFTPEESDRLARLGRLVDLAEEVLGSREAGVRWLEEANVALDGLAPLELASTGIGAAEVEALLVRIEHGVVA